MLSALFTQIGLAVTSVVTLLGDAFDGAIGLIYDGTVVTDFGVLMLISAGVGLVFFAFRFITRLLPKI